MPSWEGSNDHNPHVIPALSADLEIQCTAYFGIFWNVNVQPNLVHIRTLKVPLLLLQYASELLFY
jgi:hypothetical protein